MDRFFCRNDKGHCYEVEWCYGTWAHRTKNKNGITGWVKVLRGNGDWKVGLTPRVHKCQFNPCTVRFGASKYGDYGPREHIQEISEEEYGPQSSPLPTGHIPAPSEFDPQLMAQVNADTLSTCAGDPSSLDASRPQLRACTDLDANLAKARVYDTIFKLSRQISRAGNYVGYSFFVLMALLKGVRPIIWEGDSRVDLIECFAPWAGTHVTKACAVDGVACCMLALDGGRCEMVHVSERAPLDKCKHWLACHQLNEPLECHGESIQSFYARLGMVLLGTVMDGNCGPDTACMMLGLPQTAQNYATLRREVADYLNERYDCQWIHDLMITTQELDPSLVMQYRDLGVQTTVLPSGCVDPTGGLDPPALDPPLPPPGEGPAVQKPFPLTTSAVAEAPSAMASDTLGRPPSEGAGTTLAVPAAGELTSDTDIMDALRWSTRVNDVAVLHGLMVSLPEWALQEQLAAFRTRKVSTYSAGTSGPRAIVVHPK